MGKDHVDKWRRSLYLMMILSLCLSVDVPPILFTMLCDVKCNNRYDTVKFQNNKHAVNADIVSDTSGTFEA